MKKKKLSRHERKHTQHFMETVQREREQSVRTTDIDRILEGMRSPDPP
jgi:hypothetical protein